MTTYTDHVLELSDETKKQMILDRDKFEEDGFIGDCVLRRETQRFMDGYNMTHVSAASIMCILASECDKYFAKKYLNGR